MLDPASGNATGEVAIRDSAASWGDDESGAGCFPGGPPPPPTSSAHYSQFTARGDRVLVADGTHVLAYSLATCPGSTAGCHFEWNTDVGAGIVPPLVATGNTISVATATGNIVVLDATTGAKKWTDAVGSAVSQPIAATNTTLFAAASNGTLAAFPIGGCGTSTCTPSWHATTSAASTRPSIGGDVVYVGSADGTVTAFNANGCGGMPCTSLWSADAGSKITGAPVIVAAHVIVGTSDGHVVAYTR